MSLVVYPAIERKLRDKHGVTVDEVEEAFLNRDKSFAEETRPSNQGASPRKWFIAETDAGRRLKVVFAEDPDESGPVLITAYEPNREEELYYESLQSKDE